MRSVVTATGVLLGLGIVGAAHAEQGGFFKNLFGGGEAKSAVEDSPGISGSKLFDPNGTYCPAVSVREGSSALQAFAGAAGDGNHLRHQITFARLSRECAARPDGAVGVKVGVELRALLGPSGASGTFEAPLTVSVRFLDKTLDARTRQVRVTVPAGSAQGIATVVEDGLIVPAAQSGDYDIEVALAGAAAKPRAPKVAARRSSKPARAEASADGGAPVGEQ